MEGDIQVGRWLVQPKLNSISGNGKTARVEPKVMQVLVCLAEHAGDVVEKERLIHVVWADTFVTDDVLTRAISELRKAFNDDPQKPQFIETIPKRGYRLIAQVEPVVAGLAPLSSGKIALPGLDAGRAPQGLPLRKGWKVFVPVAVILFAAVIGWRLYFHSRQIATHLTDKDTIVLSDFDNKTGEPVFDDTLKQALAIQLEQSPFLNILSDQRLNATLALMARREGERVTEEIALEICQRTGSKAVLAGAIAALGSQYVIGLNAINCSTRDVLARQLEQAGTKEQILSVLGREASSMRNKLGESLATVHAYDVPVEQATTASLVALKAYSMGMRTGREQGETAALPFFKQAIDLDANFAMAYLAMASAYGDLSEIGLARQYSGKAYELRAKVSERERMHIEYFYYILGSGELGKAVEVLRLWQHTYPNDPKPVVNLAFTFSLLGDFENMLKQMREAFRMDSTNLTAYINMAGAYEALNRLEEAEAMFNAAEKRGLNSEMLLATRYMLAFLKSDEQRMASLSAAAVGKAGAEDLMLAFQAKTEAWHGRIDAARVLTQKAVEAAVRNDSKETAAYYEAEAALREAEVGNRRYARRWAKSALERAPNRDVRAMVALALARAGDTVSARNIVEKLDRDFPLDTLVQNYWLPAIRAAVELEHQHPTRAIELLQVASPYDLSQPTAWESFLYPIYLRGEAHLMLRDGNAARIEFQKFTDYRGAVANFHLGAVSQLGLARSYELQGDSVNARKAYRDFLGIWSDSAQGTPLLAEARLEYARLK